MFKLAMLFQGIVGSTIASVLVVVGLVNGVSGLFPLLGLAGLGLVLGLPVSLLIAKRMMDDD